VADEMASRSLSYNGALQDLGTLLHRIALAQTVPTAVPEDLPELADIQRLATVFDPQEVQLYYQIAVHGRNEIGLAPDEYAGFTMTLLRMLAFRPGQGGAEQVASPAPAAIARPLPQAQAARPAAAAAAAGSATPAARAAAPGAAPMASSPAPAAPAPAAPQAHQQAPAPQAPAAQASGAALSPARAAINAALEAARAASRMPPGGRRPSGPSEAPAAPQPAAAAPAPAPAPAAPGSAPMASAAPSTAPAARPSAPDPWDQPAARPQAQSAAQPQPAMRQAPAHASAQAQAQTQQQGHEQAVADDEPPSWVTEFSDDTAVAAEAPATVSAPPVVRTAAPSAAPHAYVITPVPAIGWDGNWPALAASLPLRGVAQQLAFQTELIGCTSDGSSATFRLRVPVDTLRASGNSEKLCAALQERFPAVRVNIDTEIGPVWYTASAEAKARREQLQREAEETVGAAPFIQALEQTFDAFVVPGSVRPIGT
jgi:DNA polymerase-3 subunit gamma/tau